MGTIQVLRNVFSWEFDSYAPPRNANNVEPYTFVTLVSGKADPPSTPTALCNTQMALTTIKAHSSYVTLFC